MFFLATLRRKEVMVPLHKAASISFLVKAKKLGDIAIKIEASNKAAYDRIENKLHVIQESLLISKSVGEYFDLFPHGTYTFSMGLRIYKYVPLDSVALNVSIISK